jgi:hypothetical protein
LNESRHRHTRPKKRPDWRHVHHSPIFWMGVALFLVAISLYVFSDDLSWRPMIVR